MPSTVDARLERLENMMRVVYTKAGTGGSGAVDSVFGRTGAVVAAANDYTPFQVGATPRPSKKRWAYTTMIGNAATTTNIGTGNTSTGTVNFVGGSATEPYTLKCTCAATSGNDMGWYSGATVYVWHFAKTMYFESFMAFIDLTKVRIWLGLYSSDGPTMAASDNPAGDYVAFFYNPDVNANILCITKDGTTQNITNTGIAADTTGRLFAIEHNPGVSDLFYIDGVLVATHTANLPRTAVGNIRWIGPYGETTENVAKAVGWAWTYIEIDES